MRTTIASTRAARDRARAAIRRGSRARALKKNTVTRAGTPRRPPSPIGPTRRRTTTQPTDHTWRDRFRSFCIFFSKKKPPQCARCEAASKKMPRKWARENISARRRRQGTARARSTHPRAHGRLPGSAPGHPFLHQPRCRDGRRSAARVNADRVPCPCRPPPEGDLDLRHRVDQITPRKVRRGSSCVPPRIRERRRTRHGFRLWYV